MSYIPSKQRKYKEKDQTEQTVIQKHSEFRSCTWKLEGREGAISEFRSCTWKLEGMEGAISEFR